MYITLAFLQPFYKTKFFEFCLGYADADDHPHPVFQSA